MNLKQLYNFGLRFPWNIHARILFLTALGSVFFTLLTGSGSLIIHYSISFLIMFVDTEIFFWVSRSLFKSFKSEYRNKFIRQVVARVVVFFFMILVVGTIVASSVITLFQSQWQGGLKPAFNHLLQYELKGIVLSLLIGAVIATLMFFIIMWLEMMKILFQTREQMLVYQSETLKNQVNPHFLFNSLNTLSSLIKPQPDKAEIFTQKLADIYRYIIENRDVNFVPLKKEIEFVNDFFFLQKLRDEDKIELVWKIENDTCKVLPISLQLLVENAFKHNAATREKPLTVSIIQTQSGIVVSNLKRPKKQLGDTSGTGLSNLSQRINLLTGNEMKIEESDTDFVVTIPLLCK
ncbi:MAG TPA: histidine kinase [Prolixibacteraceae bacterium]|nr:histidine kinase [Prolixibacteraceae bacterium]HPR60218.1 histidine kinase [Prolixibacteraceae bacterium]